MTAWVSRWAGSYTFISCSYWATQYARTLKRILGKGFDKAVFLHKEGTASFHIEQEGLDAFGEHCAKKGREETLTLLQTLKENTDAIIQLIGELEGKIPTQDEYTTFHSVFDKHLAYHNFMKKTPDYLSQDMLESQLPTFEDARLYSEAVYSRTEQFFRALAGAIAKKTTYSQQALTCLTQGELETYLQHEQLPKEKELLKRYRESAILLKDNQLIIVTGERAKKIEEGLFQRTPEQVQGDIAYPGTVRGTCRVIQDPHDVQQFNKGDILVTGMTRPEFSPFIEQAAGIVTDVGGVLCHAAITAREKKLPCITGTRTATRVLQDGETIEIRNGHVKLFR